MGTTERRNEILKVLCRRGYETAGNLAFEFGVSERTVRRDIEVLSRNNPIYTKSGGHAGGIYIVGGYSPDRMYMSDAEIYVLKKLYTLPCLKPASLNSFPTSVTSCGKTNKSISFEVRYPTG